MMLKPKWESSYPFFNFYLLDYSNEIKNLFMAGLSMDGDSQGAERLFGALSAYMWPGMILKSGDKITEPSLPEHQGFTISGQ